MITRRMAPLLDWYAARRRRALERVSRDAAQIQERALLSLVAAARDTEFGLAHGFASIRSIADYQACVPVGEYRDVAPLLHRALGGECSIVWPGRTRDWVRTAGTTAGPKIIPVTAEAFSSHQKGAWDAFLMGVGRVGARHLVGGPMLLLGGSTAFSPAGDGGQIGDLSGFIVRRLPPGIRGLYSPGPELSAIPDWGTRIDAVAALASRQDVRLLAGIPSWLVDLLERVARARQTGGCAVRDLGQCWPNLRVLIHGGVAFAPYASALDEWIGRRLERIEVYPASEGFVGMQTEASGGLTLMLDYGIFYEFIPVEDLGGAKPRRHTVAEVELGRAYAVVVSTPAGLWSYLLGDTVRFTKRDPLRLFISGRTRHYVNACGENVIVEEVERALVGACRRTEAEVVEFTVAPRFPSAGEPRSGHEWLVEFRVCPSEPDDFVRILDETLVSLNGDYRTRRSGDLEMVPPRVTALPPGTFHRWMRDAGKLGDHHKVPRAMNDRALAEALLAVAGEQARPLVPSHPGAFSYS